MAENPKNLPIDKLQDVIKDQIYKSKRIYVDQFECEFTTKLEDLVRRN